MTAREYVAIAENAAAWWLIVSAAKPHRVDKTLWVTDPEWFRLDRDPANSSNTKIYPPVNPDGSWCFWGVGTFYPEDYGHEQPIMVADLRPLGREHTAIVRALLASAVETWESAPGKWCAELGGKRPAYMYVDEDAARNALLDALLAPATMEGQ